MFPGYISSTIIVMFRAKVGKDCSLLWNILTSNIQQLTHKYFETFITSFPSSSFLCFFDRTPGGFGLTLFFIYPTALPELWIQRLSSSLWPTSCSCYHTLVVAYSCFWVEKVKDRPLLLCTCRKNKCHLPRYIIYVSAVTAPNWLIEINYTWYNSFGKKKKKVISYHANTLCKYHWFSMNSFWPSGLRLLLCDVHNSLNTGPLLLLRVGGQACSVKSKRISSPINNQLQDCSPNDRPEKIQGKMNKKWRNMRVYSIVWAAAVDYQHHQETSVH